MRPTDRTTGLLAVVALIVWTVAVTLVAPAAGAATTTVATGGSLDRPYGLAFDGSGTLFVANEVETGPAVISSLDVGTGVVSTFSSGAAVGGFVGLSGAAVSPLNGLLHVSDDSNRVFQLTATGVASVFYDGPEVDQNPNGIAFDVSGNLYVTSSGLGTVAQLDAGGALLDDNITDPDTTFSVPQGIAVDGANGRVLVQELGGDISSIDLTTGAVSLVAAGVGDGNAHLALDRAGNIYAASDGDGRVLRVDAGDSTVTSCALIPSARGIAVDGSDTVFVTNQIDAEVVRIDSCLGLPPDAGPNTIQASVTNDWVQGQSFEPGTPVDITVNGDFFDDAAVTDGAGFFFTDALGVDLVAGDAINVTDGINSRDLTLVDLTFDIDADNDSVSGTTDQADGTAVSWGVGNETEGIGDTATASSGAWTSPDLLATFGFDITPDMGGSAEIVDADGDATIAEPPPPPPMPNIVGSSTSDWVGGGEWFVDATVTIDVNSGAHVFAGVVVTDGGFFFETGLDLVPGDLIVVAGDDSGATKDLTLAELDFTTFDFDASIAEGTAPFGSVVYVAVRAAAGPFCGDVVADGPTGEPGIGMWAVDFSGPPCPPEVDPLPDPGGGATLGDHDGDHTFVDAPLTENAAPDCSAAEPSIAELWPPNHQMVDITVNGLADADGDPITMTIDSIFQDEPVDENGDGDTEPDGAGTGTSTAHVRAERQGGGNGRVYHVGFTADDGRGGICSGVVLVSVPRNQGKKGAAVDDGPLHDSTVVA